MRTVYTFPQSKAFRSGCLAKIAVSAISEKEFHLNGPPKKGGISCKP